MDSKYRFCCIRQSISLPTCKFHEWIWLLFPDRPQNRKKKTQKTKVPTPGRKGQFNDKAGIIQFMPWPLSHLDRHWWPWAKDITNFSNKIILLYHHAPEAWAVPALPKGLRCSSQLWNEQLQLPGARMDLQFQYCLVIENARFSTFQQSNISS